LKASKLIFILPVGLLVVILVAGTQFFFNPLGLGPEPEKVLGQEFFAEPAQDLSGLELMVDGQEVFERIRAAIDSAASSIYIQSYIWKDDSTGKQVVEGLKTAADRGVNVSISKDIVGTVFEVGDILKGKPSPVFSKAGLKDYDNIGVCLHLFADTDHSKYFIVDERLVIFGGMNIADEYRDQWHDYMALFENCRWATAFKNKVLKGTPWPTPSPFIITVNDRKYTEIRTALIELLDNCSEDIIIEHAYFSDAQLIAAIKKAAARGVKVSIILPEKPDTHQYANMVTVNQLLDSDAKNGISIYLFPKMSHAKVMLADSKIAVIGSANLTPRSMRTSREVALFLHGNEDDPFLRNLKAQLMADMAESKLVLNPFRMGFTAKVKALVGKYVW
jgi:cardiolipin synthase A/B